MDINKIKVSIIMPVYNNELFIRKSVESVLQQTHTNFELIVVDDCSTDKTIEIVEGFNDQRIKIIKNTSNMGAAFSRNIALENTTGQYIAFLDGDDFWDTDKLKKQLLFMIGNKYDFSYTNYKIYDFNSKKDVGFLSGPKVLNYKDFLRCNYLGCLTVMYKKEIFPNLKIPNQIKKRNDYALWILLSTKSSCHLLNECLATYVKTGTGISSGKKGKLFISHYKLFRMLLNCSRIKAIFLAIRNVLFYFFKRIRFFRKKSSTLNGSKNF